MKTPQRILNQLTFEHDYATLPSDFYTHVAPTPLPQPYLVDISPEAAALIDLDSEAFAADRKTIDLLSGTSPLTSGKTLAAVYSGHQFGVWAGQLGDGRALLLGDVPLSSCVAKDPWNPRGRIELALKGSGPTPYSRRGDGRAVLRSSIREYLCSEAMAGLGIPTSRTLCVIGSDQRVLRETPETTAVVTRMAPSFVRFGSFEHWYYQQQPESLQALGDYVLDRFFPQLHDQPSPFAAMLGEIVRRTARLVAAWQAAGFMHGVLNTDNMSILGLTLDYGPYGFMDGFDPRHICNHTDQGGRYSYENQPEIGHWNCYALGQAMLPLIGDVEQTEAALRSYQPEFDTEMVRLARAKLGLQNIEPDDQSLYDALLLLMAQSRADYTRTFRRLASLSINGDDARDASLRDQFIDRDAFDHWVTQYRARLGRENSQDGPRALAMSRVNPKYVLRNHLAQIAIDKAQQKDFSEVVALRKLLTHPYDEQPDYESYSAAPPDWARGLEVSCSS
jgi:uncharacterized protein YdiU (UPF0061 family)